MIRTPSIYLHLTEVYYPKESFPRVLPSNTLCKERKVHAPRVASVSQGRAAAMLLLLTYENKNYGLWIFTSGIVLTQLVQKFNNETLDNNYPKIELQLFIYPGNMFYFTSLGQSDCLG